MCSFFSFCSNGKGQYYYFDWITRKKIIDGDNNFSSRVESFPCIRIMPNPRGGCFIFRDEKIDDKSNEYYKLGYLER